MKPAHDGLPLVARNDARALGVRVPEDIDSDRNGRVAPHSGGMSTAPCSAEKIPNHRRPRGMGAGATGKPTDRVYAVEFRLVLEADLTIRPDPDRPTKHAFVEPNRSETLAEYEQALANTRTQWQQVWP
jgi:hypothetical protein